MNKLNYRNIVFCLYIITIILAAPGIIEYYLKFDISETLQKYQHLSGWIQSLGALLAIFFTIYSFKRKDKENETLKKEENDVKKLEAITEIIGDGTLLEKINLISSTFNNKTSIDNTYLAYRKFTDAELKTLVKGYGLSALIVQKELIKIDEKIKKIKTLKIQIQRIEEKYEPLERALMPNLSDREIINNSHKIINNLKALISEDALSIKNEINLIVADIDKY